MKEHDIKVCQRLNYITNNSEILNESFMAGLLFRSQEKKVFFFGIIPSNKNVLSETSFCNKLCLRPILLQKAMFHLKHTCHRSLLCSGLTTLSQAPLRLL